MDLTSYGGTILATRMTTKAQTANLLTSIKAGNKRAQIAEKRRVYAEFLASVDTMMPFAYKYRIAKGQAQSDEEKNSAFDEMMQAEGVMMRTSMEARLLAPPPIRQLIGSLVNAYLEYCKATIDGVTELVKVEEPAPMSIIIDAMRVDLEIDE